MKNQFILAVLLASSLLPFTAFADRFDRPGRPGYGPRPGAAVWTESGLEGRVEAVFPDGRISVKINYTNYTFQRHQLASQGCFRGLCSGSDVITTSGLRGRVNGVFPAGSYSVKINYSNYQFRFEDLASANPRPDPGPYPGLRVGATVWTRSGLEGKVAGLFPSGEVSVTINYTQYKFGQYDLAQVGCVYDLCSGDSVITQSGLRGVVNGAFPDNKVSVKINYSSYQFDYSQLARTRQ